MAEIGVVDAGQRSTDDAEFLDVPVGLRERDLTVGVALRRIVAVLLQQLARLLAAAAAARVQRDAAVELVEAHLQQLLQQGSLPGTQEVGHGSSQTVTSATSSREPCELALMVINPGAATRRHRLFAGLPRMAGLNVLP